MHKFVVVVSESQTKFGMLLLEYWYHCGDFPCDRVILGK